MKPRHLEFVLKYLETNNARQSYAAVYPNATIQTANVKSSQLLRRPEIKEYINKHNAKIEEKSNLNILDVLARVDKIALDPKVAPSTKLKANEMILRALGAFTDKVHMTGETTTNITVDHTVLTDEELQRMIESDE
jgi:hypothetical protein